MSFTDKEKLKLINDCLSDQAINILLQYRYEKQEANGMMTVNLMLDELETTTEPKDFNRVLSNNNQKDFPVTTKITIEANGDSVEIMNIVDDVTIRNMKKILNRQLDIKQEQMEAYMKEFLEEV